MSRLAWLSLIALSIVSAPVRADVPNPIDEFKRTAMQLAVKERLWVTSWGEINLDNDPAMERIARLCPASGNDAGLVLIEKDSSHRFVYRFEKDGRNSFDCEGEAPIAEPPWSHSDDHSLVFDLAYHHEEDGTEIAIRNQRLVVISENHDAWSNNHDDEEQSSYNWDSLVDTSAGECGARPMIPVLRSELANPATTGRLDNYTIAGKAKWKGPADASVQMSATSEDGETVEIHLASTDDTRVLPAAKEKHPDRFDHFELWWWLPHKPIDENAERASELIGVLLTQDSAGDWVVQWMHPPGAKRIAPTESYAVLPTVTGTLEHATVTFAATELGATDDQATNSQEWNLPMTALYADADDASHRIKSVVGSSDFTANKPQCMSELARVPNGDRYRNAGEFYFAWPAWWGWPPRASTTQLAADPATDGRLACERGNLDACVTLGYDYQAGNGVTKDDANALASFTKACDGGNGYGCYGQAMMYERGIGVAINHDRAVELFEKTCSDGGERGCDALGTVHITAVAERLRSACDGGDLRSCLHFGALVLHSLKAIESRVNEDNAVALFTEACDGGEMRGCNELGFAYRANSGFAATRTDAAKSAAMFARACNGGNLQSCEALGSDYDRGDGVAKSTSNAFALYEKMCNGENAEGCAYLLGNDADAKRARERVAAACKRGDLKRCGALGVAYADNDQTVLAAPLLEKACRGGNAEGCHRLATLDHRPGESESDDAAAKSAALLTKACDLGSMTACRDLAELTNDVARASTLYQKACDGDDFASCNILADLYKKTGVPADATRADTITTKACRDDDNSSTNQCQLLQLAVQQNIMGQWKLACNGGDLHACVRLGLGYRRNLGDENPDVAAARLFGKACDGGNLDGCVALADVRRDATTELLYETACEAGNAKACIAAADSIAADKAANLYAKACESGSAQACAKIAAAYRYGVGVIVDLANAAVLNAKACRQGSPQGCFDLSEDFKFGIGVNEDPQRAATLSAYECGSSRGCASADRWTQWTVAAAE